MKANRKKGNARPGAIIQDKNIKLRKAARWVGDKCDEGIRVVRPSWRNR